MERIDDKKVLFGGLIAGASLMAGSVTLGRLTGSELVVAIMQGPGIERIGGMELWGYAWAHLLIGIAVAWLHQVLRPHYGAGIRAAARAGLAVWVVAMPAPILFQLVLRLDSPAVQGGTMAVALVVSAALFVVAALAAAGAGAILQPAGRSAEAATEIS